MNADEMQKRLDAEPISNAELLRRIRNERQELRASTVKITKWNRDKKPDTTYFYNIPVSFDIETTQDPETETAYMYIWQLNFNGHTTTGRTWKEFNKLLSKIATILNLNTHRQLVIYIHNLSYEAAFILPRLNIETMFCKTERKPVYIETREGVTWRDSYILSGMSLDTVGKNLTQLKARKLVGALNYRTPRNSQTKLTEREIAYCVNDVKVLTAYIWEQLQIYKEITKIPLTNTGRVREYMRTECLKSKEYRQLMHCLTLTPEEYTALKQTYQGGFTHAGHKHSGEILQNVNSVDFTSSYPAVECADYYPMSAGEPRKYKTAAEYIEDCKEYCVMALVQFDKISEKFTSEHYITTSKIIAGSGVGVIAENGRLIRAEKAALWITELDLKIIAKCYNFNITPIAGWRYKRGKLPKQFVQCVLNLYADKTTLKGVEGKEAEYQLKKGMLNSSYGMTVTDIITAEVEYYSDETGSEWHTNGTNIAADIDKYNKDKRRFLYYPWGVWITAHARERLWRGILECGDDYIYSDTDSIKYINPERHEAFFKSYNAAVIEAIKETCKEYEINPKQATPRTIDGVEKPLGVWDYEGFYKQFKTLGAKRYIIEGHVINGKIKEEHAITIAGISKKKGGDYIFKQADPFQFFNQGMTIPAEASGKTVAKYTDKPTTAVISDEQGHTETMREKSCVYIADSDYKMNIPETYLNYIESGRAGHKSISREIAKKRGT